MLKVFVSSTFNDMHIERDCLEDIQQDINTQLLESGEKIEFVDLRWGICTEALDEEGKNRAVLEGCFSAIDKSDYLLVFLGNRYGSLKSYNEVLEYLGKQKTDILFRNSSVGMSVTELEVTYSQLVRGFDSNNTIVCIRDEHEIEEDAQKFIDSFVTDQSYERSILHYSNADLTVFKNNLKNHLSQMMAKHIAQDTGFAKDRRRLENLAVDAILNKQMTSFNINHKLLIFSGESGIGKTTTAAEILRRNYGKKLCPFVTWSAKESNLTYDQLLVLLVERFSEWYREKPNDNDIKGYIQKSVSRLSSDGYQFVLFLDSEENISGVKYRQLLDLVGPGILLVSTTNYQKIISEISSFTDYIVFKEEDIIFRSEDIKGIIKEEFEEHGKKIRSETIDILARKTDILKPLYLYFAVKRLLFLKAYDFKKCAQNESPEVKVLSEIATEIPDTLDELLAYSLKNISENSDISLQMKMVLDLLSESYKGVTENVILEYLMFKGVKSQKSDVMPYVYEIMNRIGDFISSDGIWYNRRFKKEIYSIEKSRTDVKAFVESKKKDYRNEYYIREYMYWNCDNTEKLYSFLSARALWKFENASVRAIYRSLFWKLVEDSIIKEKTLDKAIFMNLFEMYENTDEYYTGLICDKDPVFRLLTEEIHNEIRNYQNGDSIFFLFRIAEVYIEELIWINNSAKLICIDDIPMDVLTIFEKLSYVYKVFAKSLLNTRYSERDLKKIYDTLAEQTVKYGDLINSLSCAEMLIDNIDERSVTYYHNAVRLMSAADFLINLGVYDERYSCDNDIYGNGIYFNWRCKSYKVFDTVKYMLMYTLSEWVKDFNTIGSQFAMDIVAIDYYLKYVERGNLMTPYDDALMLSLLILYETYKLSHFRKYAESIEKYWVENYPYTRLVFCSKPEDLIGDDYEIRDTVKDTVTELVRALGNVYSNENVSLTEKCTLNLLGNKILILLLNAELTEKHKAELVIPLAEVLSDTYFLKGTLENEDLHVYIPYDYLLDTDEDVIRQAVKELNFNCI